MGTQWSHSSKLLVYHQYHYKNEIFHVALTHWPKSSGLEPRGGPVELLLDVH